MNYDRGGYRGRGGGGGGYNNNGGGGRGGRGGGFGGRGGGHGGRGGYNNNGNGEYNNNGGHYDRKRRYDSEYEQRPPKRQYEEPKPDPTPIDFEVEGNVAGQNNRFFYKEKQQVPAQLTAIHTIRIHGRLDNTVSFGNQNDLVMFLANCGGFLKQGVSLMDKSPSTVPMNIQDVSTKMKTICQALLGTCELIEVDTKKLNLLQLPVFGRVPEMKVVIEPESTLEIASIGIKSLIDWLHGRQGKKGMKKLDFYTTNNVLARQFLHKLKLDNADAQYVVRITCPNPPLDEFTYNSGKKSQLKLVKEKDVKGGASFILYKYPEEQPEPSTKIRDTYPKLSQISITNVPMPQPGAAN